MIHLADPNLVLDPYILNVFPRTLLPTAVYIVILLVGSWFLSDSIWNWLRRVSEGPKPHTE